MEQERNQAVGCRDGLAVKRLADEIACYYGDGKSGSHYIATLIEAHTNVELARQYEELMADKNRLDWIEKNEVSMNRLSESQTDLREHWHIYYYPSGRKYGIDTRHFGKLGQSLRAVLDEAMTANTELSEQPRENL